ncbi:MAG: ABC transporter permease, partial [Clostridia bacterium]
MENKEKAFKNPLSFQVDPDLFRPATDAEKEQQVSQRESVSFMRDAMRRLSKNRMAMVCLTLILLIALIAFVVPEIYPY